MDLNIDLNYQKKILAGIDEAGRGPLSGPVVAAAVIANSDNIIEGINDSKKLSEQKRDVLYEEIITRYQYGVGIVEANEIDQINILQATIKACRIAASNLNCTPDIILVDGNMHFADKRFKSIVKGDTKSHTIAAASIVAKVTRDRIMAHLHCSYPEYNWQKNKGYGSREHLKAIANHGICEYHRKTFKFKKLSI
ncbi:MAG TPA: ribonuclease HII [Candidatus Megaira endosymbiont of Nemacystus decipiens]|nr:ribonuclease HII [Candidatus Megaera endosymbiont of Nemacystus decipiens]